MEDFSSILWVILVVAGLAASVISKRKEQQKNSAPDTERDSEPHPFPTPAAPAPWQSAQPRKRMQTSGSEVENKETTGTIGNRGLANTNTRKSHKPASTAPNNAFIRQTNASEGFNAECSETDAHSDVGSGMEGANPEGQKKSLIDDFDPRKAVVWSEILKPKFDEESH